MSTIRRNLTEDVTYWGVASRDDRNKITFSSPVTVQARWEERAVLVEGEGGEFQSKAVVHIEQNVVREGRLYRGVSVAADPTTVTGALPIKEFAKIPNLRGTDYERRGYL